MGKRRVMIQIILDTDYLSCRKKLVRFLRRFCLKTVIDFVHFGLESGTVFEGTTGVYEHIYRLVPNE